MTYNKIIENFNKEIDYIISKLGYENEVTISLCNLIEANIEFSKNIKLQFQYSESFFEEFHKMIKNCVDEYLKKEIE